MLCGSSSSRLFRIQYVNVRAWWRAFRANCVRARSTAVASTIQLNLAQFMGHTLLHYSLKSSCSEINCPSISLRVCMNLPERLACHCANPAFRKAFISGALFSKTRGTRRKRRRRRRISSIKSSLLSALPFIAICFMGLWLRNCILLIIFNLSNGY